MISKIRRGMTGNEGFTLIELMIVVAIIGILAAVAVPNFVAYRNRSQVAAAKATMESVRGALAAYAATDPNNYYPLDTEMGDYGAMQTTLTDYGANLPDPGNTGITSAAYTSDGTTYSIAVVTKATGIPGATFTVTPGGIKND